MNLHTKLIFIVRATCCCMVLAACGTNPEDVKATDEQLFSATGKLYSEAKASELARKGEIGASEATALVPLAFDTTGRLLTAEEVNNLIDNNTWDAQKHKALFTDFGTYQTVMQNASSLGLQSTERAELVKDSRYVSAIPATYESVEALGGDSGPSGSYLFDPFQRYYETADQHQEKMAQKATLAAAQSTIGPSRIASKGDIAFTNQSKSGGLKPGLGHTGMITYTAFRVFPGDQTNTGEAVGFRPLAQTTEIVRQRSTISFARTKNAQVTLLSVPSLSTSQQDRLSSYHVYQDERNNSGRLYYDTVAIKAGDLLNYDRVYCSLLQWKAYKYVTGIDIDDNGGLAVTPREIYSDNNVRIKWNKPY